MGSFSTVWLPLAFQSLKLNLETQVQLVISLCKCCLIELTGTAVFHLNKALLDLLTGVETGVSCVETPQHKGRMTSQNSPRIGKRPWKSSKWFTPKLWPHYSWLQPLPEYRDNCGGTCTTGFGKPKGVGKILKDHRYLGSERKELLKSSYWGYL